MLGFGPLAGAPIAAQWVGGTSGQNLTPPTALWGWAGRAPSFAANAVAAQRSLPWIGQTPALTGALTPAQRQIDWAALSPSLSADATPPRATLAWVPRAAVFSAIAAPPRRFWSWVGNSIGPAASAKVRHIVVGALAPVRRKR